MVLETQSEIDDLADQANGILTTMRRSFGADAASKELDVRYGMEETAKRAGISKSTLYRLQRDGQVPVPEKKPESGRSIGYTLEQLNAVRKAAGSLPYRAEEDDPVVVAVQNFKGGVGKTTVAVHLSQYLAQNGYRVLLIDADSQASSTACFGYNPDDDIAGSQTLLPVLTEGAALDLEYAVRPTYWDNLDLIPANLELYTAEYLLAGIFKEDREAIGRLKKAVEVTASAYDVVVIDPPPALGMISLSVIPAANAMLIPTPPHTIDFASTSTFLSMMSEVITMLEKRNVQPNWKFVRFILTKTDLNKAAQAEMHGVVHRVFGDRVLRTPLLSSAEYDAASLDMRSLYEVTSGRNRTYHRARHNLDTVFREVEEVIRSTWQSARANFIEKGRY